MKFVGAYVLLLKLHHKIFFLLTMLCQKQMQLVSDFPTIQKQCWLLPTLQKTLALISSLFGREKGKRKERQNHHFIHQQRLNVALSTFHILLFSFLSWIEGKLIFWECPLELLQHTEISRIAFSFANYMSGVDCWINDINRIW